VPADVTGLALTALPTGFAVAAVSSSLLPGHLPATARGVAGLGSAAAALLVLAGGLRPASLAGVLLVCALGLGLFTPANNAAVMGAAPASRSGVLGGLLNMSRGLGTAMGVAATTLILHLALGAHDQLRPVALMLAAAAACGSVLSIRRPPAVPGASQAVAPGIRMTDPP
jgi:MFS family permease